MQEILIGTLGEGLELRNTNLSVDYELDDENNKMGNKRINDNDEIT